MYKLLGKCKDKEKNLIKLYSYSKIHNRPNIFSFQQRLPSSLQRKKTRDDPND